LTSKKTTNLKKQPQKKPQLKNNHVGGFFQDATKQRNSILKNRIFDFGWVTT